MLKAYSIRRAVSHASGWETLAVTQPHGSHVVLDSPWGRVHLNRFDDALFLEGYQEPCESSGSILTIQIIIPIFFSFSTLCLSKDIVYDM